MQSIKKRNENYKYSKEIINNIYNKIRPYNKTFNNNSLIGSGELKTIKYQFCEIFSVIYIELYIRLKLRTLLDDHMMTYL
jgi:hypothetical protein